MPDELEDLTREEQVAAQIAAGASPEAAEQIVAISMGEAESDEEAVESEQ